MSEEELIQEIRDEISASCSLPYNLNEQEIKRIIKKSRRFFYDNYQYAVEDKIFVLGKQLFSHPAFRATRQILLPSCVRSVWDVRQVSGAGLVGTPDKDFGDSKLLGSELMLSPFAGDNLVYRTVLYSFFDLAKAYLLETYAFSYNKNTKKLTILGRDPSRGRQSVDTGSSQDHWDGYDLGIRAYIDIPEESLYEDELFIRWTYAEAKINIGRLLGTFEYNLPGGVRVNYQNIQSLGTTEKTEILQQIRDENSASYFLQWN